MPLFWYATPTLTTIASFAFRNITVLLQNMVNGIRSQAKQMSQTTNPIILVLCEPANEPPNQTTNPKTRCLTDLLIHSLTHTLNQSINQSNPHSLTGSLTHSPAHHPFTNSPTYTFSPSPTYPPTHSLTNHSLTDSNMRFSRGWLRRSLAVFWDLTPWRLAKFADVGRT